MFFDGYIGAPPTCTVFSARAFMPFISAKDGAAKPSASAAAAAVVEAIKRVRDISISCDSDRPSRRMHWEYGATAGDGCSVLLHGCVRQSVGLLWKAKQASMLGFQKYFADCRGVGMG